MNNIILLVIIALLITAIFLMIWFLKRSITENKINDKDHNLEKISLMLDPLKDQLNRLNDLYVEIKTGQRDTKEFFNQEISKMAEQTAKISVDAENLTTALKGDSKTQGDWGEMILENSLNHSELRKGIDYILQKSYKDEDGSTLIADAIVFLPENRQVVIDSKVSIKAYHAYMQATNADEKNKFLNEHISSLKKHIKTLSEANYKNLEGIVSLDYQLIFVPIESALSLALSNDWDLQKQASKHRIGFVTPVNLIAVLRIVESLWAVDKQNKNGAEIAKRAGLLIDKLEGLRKDFADIERYFNQTAASFDNLKGKLSDGQGNLISQAKKLHALGAKAKKSIED